MNDNHGLQLIAPRVEPALDPEFRPAVLASRAFRKQVNSLSDAVPVGIGLEQSDGLVSHYLTKVFPENHTQAAGNFTYIERISKYLLWSRGGCRIHITGPAALAAKLTAHYRDTPTGKFDSNIVGERMFDHAIEVVHARELPPERRSAASLGRHLEGCRIGLILAGAIAKRPPWLMAKSSSARKQYGIPIFSQIPNIITMASWSR